MQKKQKNITRLAICCITHFTSSLGILVSKLNVIQNFHIEWAGDPDASIETHTQLVNSPNQALRFKLTPIKKGNVESCYPIK